MEKPDFQLTVDQLRGAADIIRRIAFELHERGSFGEAWKHDIIDLWCEYIENDVSCLREAHRGNRTAD